MKEVNLHDWKLEEIEINYSFKKINIHISYEDKNKRIISITNVRHFSITFEELWGIGSYINECIFRYGENKFETIDILLNSGDNVKVEGLNIKMI